MQTITNQASFGPSKGTNVADKLTGTVLLVEDEVLLRRMMSRTLRRFGLTVLEANDGREALDILEQHADEVSAIILDWNMPRLSGPATLQALGEKEFNIPVVVLSGQDIDDEMTATKGVWDFLPKPCPRAELRATLKEMLEQ